MKEYTMKRFDHILGIITALVAYLTAVPGFAQSTAAVGTLKEYDFFTTFQNPVGVAVDRRGNILTGILFTGEIQKLTPEGRMSHFAQLPIVNPVPSERDGCPLRPDPVVNPLTGEPMVDPDGAVVFPIRTAFMTGFARHRGGDLYVGLPTCNPETHGIWRVSRNGEEAELFASLPVKDLPKGLSLSNHDRFPLYVTNLHDFGEDKSRANCLRPDDPFGQGPGANYPCTLKVWRIDHEGNVSEWVESELFYGNPRSPLDHPHGINGIVVDKEGENVYVTVTDFGRVVRIPIINIDGSAGEPEVVFEPEQELVGADLENRKLFGSDDITIGPDGRFYMVVVRTDQLVAFSPDESSEDFTVVVDGHPLDGPTQLAFALRRLKGGTRDDRDGGPLPPLYVTSGSGRRVFLFNIATAVGEGDGVKGLELLRNAGIISDDSEKELAEQVTGLTPRPAVVRVLLDNEEE